jgi:hypothetical protein
MLEMAESLKKPIILDPSDCSYLELDRAETLYFEKQFKRFNANSYNDILKEVCRYSLENPMFAAKVFLNIDLLPFQGYLYNLFLNKNFVTMVASRGAGKSFLLAVYAILKGILRQGSKIVIVSASFRQSQVVFNYIDEIYKRSPFLQQICNDYGMNKKGPRRDTNMCRFALGNSLIMAVPLGNGDKIRGLRACTILCDEFGSIPEQIFQVVVRGFSVVSMNPIEKVKEEYRKQELISKGIVTDAPIEAENKNNQIILTGTASYEFNHFFGWVQKYKKIIECGTDHQKLKDSFGKNLTESDLLSLDPKKFAVIELPYTALPKGYMDDGIIAESKATMTQANFDMEFMAKFYKDSDGFFKASLILGNVAYKPFFPFIKGHKDKRYVMGIDPAKENDNFSIVVVEVGENYNNKVVYCWATNEKKMKESGEVNEYQTYYGACSRKIRSLMKAFNIELITMDAGGGGREVANYLQENNLLGKNEQPIWDIDDITQDTYKGLHILKMVDFNATWAADANHSLKKAFETRALTIPEYDTIGIEKELNSSQAAREKSNNKEMLGKYNYLDDSIEDVNEEIEELKKELMMIAVTATSTGKEHFDLVKQSSGQKSENKTKRRKDRYSALLLANYGLQSTQAPQVNESSYSYEGGNAKDLVVSSNNYVVGQLYSGLPHDPGNTNKNRPKVIKRSGGGVIVY